jgi:superfamily I DNA and/or RNA helicase
MKNLKFQILILIGFLIIIPLSSKAFSFDKFFEDLEGILSETDSGTQIQNEVNVQTDTGGNVVNDGEVIEGPASAEATDGQGKAKSEIHIKNVINGTEIDPVDIETQASEVKVESEIKTEDGAIIVQRETEIDSEKKTENYEVNLNQSSQSEKIGENSESTANKVEELWLNLVADIHYFLKNIFNIFK